MKRLLFITPILLLTGCNEDKEKKEKVDKYIILYEKKHGKDEAELRRAEIELGLFMVKQKSEGSRSHSVNYMVPIAARLTRGRTSCSYHGSCGRSSSCCKRYGSCGRSSSCCKR